MAKKIYLSPSEQPENLYAYGNTNEKVQCRRISAFAAEALKRCGFEVIDGKSTTLSARCKESNEWGADLHVPIHTNAYNGKVSGTRIMCHALSGEGYKASKAVFDVLAPMTLGTSENISAYPGLYEVRNTKAPCVYIEVDFHDVPRIAKWLIENAEEIGEGICKGICNYYGVKYKEKMPDTSQMYRVFVDNKQIGAFRNVEYALSLAKEHLNNKDDVHLTVRDK